MVYVLTVFIIGEVVLRFLGFGSTLLYYNNDFTGYNMQPNQECKILGKHISINEYSMRSGPIGDEEYRILVFGDSVVNGGIYTDDSSLATTYIEEQLREIEPKTRVLNVSCGGWGVDNAYGYLQQYGDFEAHTIVLLFNNHDAVGSISDSPVAGSLTFPEKQYPLAWVELLERYVLPRLGIYFKEVVDSTNTSSGNEFSKGWEHFSNYCTEHDINLIIYLHAQKNEAIDFCSYNENGKRIIEFANEHAIPICLDIENEEKEDFRDWIHLTEKGQHVISDILYPVLEEIILRRDS